jgi:hypothetical protein
VANGNECFSTICILTPLGFCAKAGHTYTHQFIMRRSLSARLGVLYSGSVCFGCDQVCLQGGFALYTLFSDFAQYRTLPALILIEIAVLYYEFGTDYKVF